MWIDTHCHLDYGEPEELVAEALAADVEALITIGVSADHLEKLMELTQKYPCVYATLGIHPHEAAQWNDDIKALITHLAKQPKMVAVGEIGLDYHYMHATKEVQWAALEAQLDLARVLQKPVVIHTRSADDDTIAILKNAQKSLPPMVLHSFSSGLALAECALSLGCYLGFNGMLTFKNADLVRQAALMCPLEQLLIETDAPYLAPIPHRGKENKSAYLPLIGQYLATLKSVTPEKLAQCLRENSRNLFVL
jgi:TatD DNase family protein